MSLARPQILSGYINLLTALIESEYESTCVALAWSCELDELARYGCHGALTVSVLNFNSLVIVTCLRLLADSADSMDLAN